MAPKTQEIPTKIFVVPGEKSLIKSFDELGYDYETEPMDVGDIQIRTQDADKNWTVVELIIERKEGKDLHASIKDGRYEEQKSRIKSLFSETFTPKQVYYLIENFPGPSGRYTYDSQPRKCMWSAITNTMYRDGFNVFQSKSVSESAEWLNSLCNSVRKHKMTVFSSSDLKVHEANLKKKKVTPTDFLKHSLMLIKGVQDDVSDPIVEKYETFSNIIRKYQNKINKGDEPGAEKMLKDLNRSSGNRKIGPVLSKRIYHFFIPELLFEETESEESN